MRVIVTGGLGYIGSHVVLALYNAGHTPIILDDLSNSRMQTLHALRELGCTPMFYRADVTDLMGVFVASGGEADAVIHLAGSKAVGESFKEPLAYYNNNVGNTIRMLQGIQKAGIEHLIFSSSAAVYAAPATWKSSLNENSPVRPMSPYGNTKAMVELILDDCREIVNSLSLRYFNPIGAHESGLLVEGGEGPPNNLFPRILNAAAGISDPLQVYGNKYMTDDGTCVRDYIHVVDLAQAHVKALEYLVEGQVTSKVMNLGTNVGTSVLELIHTFQEATGVHVPYEIAHPRQGDPAYLVADASWAMEELSWKPFRTVADACRDGWRTAQGIDV